MTTDLLHERFASLYGHLDPIDQIAAAEGDARHRLDQLRPHPRGAIASTIPATVKLRPTISLNARRMGLEVQ